MTAPKPRVAFMGTPAFALPCLAALLEVADVQLVVTQPDLKWSVGELNTLGRPVEVREGDLVVSRLQ